MALDDLDTARTRIADLLGGDTGTLRSSYLDYLSSAFDPNKMSLEPDSSASLMQGVLPAVLAGIFTKGKALAYAGEPLTSVYKTQAERAKNEATLNLESNLKKAGLVGDELARRDKITADEWDEVRDEQLKRDLARDANEQRALDREARSEDRALDRASRTETAQMMAAATKSNRDAVDSDRDASRELREQEFAEKKREKIGKDYELRAKSLKLPERIQSVESIRSALAQGLSIGDAQIATQLVTARGDTGNKAIQEQRSALPSDVYQDLAKLHNYITGGAQGTIPKVKREAISALLDIYERGAQSMNDKIKTELKARHGKRTSDYLTADDIDNEVENLGIGLGFKPSLGSSVDDDRMYQAPNGTQISGRDLKLKYGDKLPSVIDRFK